MEHLERLFQRTRNLLLTPEQEWSRISTESQSIRDITIQYLLPYTAVLVFCSLLGSLVFRVISPMGILARMVYMGACIPAGIFLAAYGINKIAPNFETQTDYPSIFRAVCFAAVPAILIWSVSELIPFLGFIKILGIYALFQYQVGVTITLPVTAEHRPIYWISGCVIGLASVWFCFLVLKNITSIIY